MTRQTLLATAICLLVVPSVQAVEAFDGNIVLGRPTNTSISVSVLSFSDQEVYGEYGSQPGGYDVTFANTMINMVRYNPDFLVDLGDTFMTSQNFGNGLFEIQNRQRGAPIREIDVVGDFLLLRGYLGQSAYTVPLFLVLGNHDTERQSRLDGTSDNIAVWANNARKHYFPCRPPTKPTGEASKKFRISADMTAGTRGSGATRCSWALTPSGTRAAGARGAGRWAVSNTTG